jgi:hypothetical protein
VKSAGPIKSVKKLQFDFWATFRRELLERKSYQAPRLPARTADGNSRARLYIQQNCDHRPFRSLRPSAQCSNQNREKLESNANPDTMDKIINLERAPISMIATGGLNIALASSTRWSRLPAGEEPTATIRVGSGTN